MLLTLLRRRTTQDTVDPNTPTSPNGRSTWLNLHSTERTRIREILGLEPHTSTKIDSLKNDTYSGLSTPSRDDKVLRNAIFAKWNDGTKSPETAYDYVSIYQFMLNDYSSININSQRIVNNPSIGMHTNYHTEFGLNAAIGNFETAGFESNGESKMNKHEPRFIDSSSGGNDRGSWYANDAAFMYMLAGGDNNSINGLRGLWLVGGIFTHLQEYSNKNGIHGKWLDPFNTARFPRGEGNFRDLNPGFFYAVWLNGLLTSYDYTSNSSVWSTAIKRQIDAWFMEWGNLFYDNIIYNMAGKWGNNWKNDDVRNAVGGSWNNKVLGTLWDSGAPKKYGFQEIYANRQVVIMSYLMRVGLYYKDHPQHSTRAKEYIRLAKQFAKETLAYAYSYEGSNIDQARTDKFANFMQTPIHYAGVALGALNQMIDAYERKCRGDVDYENMWDFTLSLANGNWDKYRENGAIWLSEVVPNNGFVKNNYTITNKYALYYKGTYESTRKKTMGGVTEPINGWSGAKRNLCRTQYDRWALRQMAYHAGVNVAINDEDLAAVFTSGRKYPIFPDSLADRVGSAQVRLGWNFFTSCWLEVGALWAMPEYNFYAQNFD